MDVRSPRPAVPGRRRAGRRGDVLAHVDHLRANVISPGKHRQLERRDDGTARPAREALENQSFSATTKPSPIENAVNPRIIAVAHRKTCGSRLRGSMYE